MRALTFSPSCLSAGWFAASSIRKISLRTRIGGAAVQYAHSSRSKRHGPSRVRAGSGRTAIVCAYETLETEQRLDLELPTADFQDSVELMVIRRPRGGNVILIQDVTSGSATAAAGVRPGQQLVAISDPIRASEVWELNQLASLRYVRQAVSGRAGDSIFVRVTEDTAPEWKQAQAKAAAKLGDGNGAVVDDASLSKAVQEELERMKEEADSMKQARRQQKLDVRNSYIEENKQRESSKPLFAALFVSLFLLLPLVILGIAFSSGYMDTLRAF